MFKRIILLLICLPVLQGFGQVSEFCGTTFMMNKWMAENPEKAKNFLKLQEQADLQDKTAFATNYSLYRMQSATVYTIPVVFHVLHLNGPENISDAQINDAVYILNRDFRKLNPDTNLIVNEFKSLAADVSFEFRLASKDEFGNCTNGITRHYDVKTNWAGGLSDYVYTWNPTMYLNIYVVQTIGNGAAGYTFLPGTAPGVSDAIVMRHDYVGSMGTSSLFSSRALTHEVGHWFNLQHVWGLTNSTGVQCGDDGVSDTPLTKGFGWCNLNNTAVCNPPIKENIQNYMDYAYCSRMFTVGQANRMTNCLLGFTAGRNNLASNSNLIATGVINPISPCAPRADFKANASVACINQSVSFTDLSYNGAITNWQWTFEDGNSVNSTAQNPTATFSVSGLKDVKLKVANSIGADSLVKSVVTVLPGAGSGTTNIAQGFETINFPDNNWITITPFIGAGWIQNNTVGAGSNKCVMIDNYMDSPSDPCPIYTPMYDISALPNPAITFDIAHSQNAGGSNDRLRVYYSVDCAASWNTLYSKSGTSLHTLGTGVFASGAFVNPQASQWRKEVVSLSALSSATSVLFKFEFVRDSMNPGNNLFLDNINVQSASGISEWEMNLSAMQLVPNPASLSTELVFLSTGSGNAGLELKDVTGKVAMASMEPAIRAGENRIKIDCATLAKGIYFVEFKYNGYFYVQKLIVD